MQDGDRDEFDKILAELFGAIDKPLTEAKSEGFWKGLAKMSLAEFARCRDVLLEGLEDGEQRKTFGVPDVWNAKKKLRARAPRIIDHSAEPKWTGDAWDVMANLHLLTYIQCRLRENPRRYGPVKQNYFRSVEDCFSPEQERATKILVAYKNAWAQDMRDMQTDDGVPVKDQKAAWRDCMQRAEDEIACLKLPVAA